MSEILDIAGRPIRPRKRQKRQQDLRDLGKIATALAVIGIGYFQFAPDRPESNTTVAIARE